MCNRYVCKPFKYVNGSSQMTLQRIRVLYEWNFRKQGSPTKNHSCSEFDILKCLKSVPLKIICLLRIVAFDGREMRTKKGEGEKLKQRDEVLINVCPMCLDNEELVDHLFLTCRFAQRMWSEMFGWFGCSWVIPPSLSNLFHAWVSPLGLLGSNKCGWNCRFLLLFGYCGRRGILDVLKGFNQVLIPWWSGWWDL